MSSAGFQPAQGRQDGGVTIHCRVDLRSTIRTGTPWRAPTRGVACGDGVMRLLVVGVL